MTDNEKADLDHQDHHDAFKTPPLLRFLSQLLNDITHQIATEAAVHASSSTSEDTSDDSGGHADTSAGTSTTQDSEAQAWSSSLDNVDVDAWVAWTLAGFELLSRDLLPSLQEAREEAQNVVLQVAFKRSNGVIT